MIGFRDVTYCCSPACKNECADLLYNLEDDCNWNNQFCNTFAKLKAEINS